MRIPDNIIDFEKHAGREPTDEAEQQPTAFIRVLLGKINAEQYEITGPLAKWLEEVLKKNLEEVIIYLLRCEAATSAPTSPEST